MSEQRLAELISAIAHELRSPLTSVKGFSATLAKKWDRFDDGQRRSFVETIATDAERMSRIVTEVLDLARIESGRLELHLVDVDVAALVRRAVERLPGGEPGGRVAIEVDGEPRAWADPERLAGVVRSLVENALKFSDEPVIVTVAARDGRAAISVADRGPGIEPELVPQIFSGPRRAAAAAAAGPTGSGLGLYLGRRVVEAHGGTLAVETAPGAGATFTVTVPASADGAV
ncbi:MAG TPA: HAMP domain-containing sensor histidine kinase [Actinomycetota bacterium]|nr:HAMP domain-containing sensor histidine kinase [Actinomycetota bacterium]